MGKPLIHVLSSASVGCALPSPMLSSRTTSQSVPSGQSVLVHVAFLKRGSQPRLRSAGASTSLMRTTTRNYIRGLGGKGFN